MLPAAGIFSGPGAHYRYPYKNPGGPGRIRKQVGAFVSRRHYYEPAALGYPLGGQLWEKNRGVPWISRRKPQQHRSAAQKSQQRICKNEAPFSVGVRKSLAHTPNRKVSDFLVPYTSSGCSAMCLYCYLVCNYNKCAYLRSCS
jgi:hypothetical protein